MTITFSISILALHEVNVIGAVAERLKSQIQWEWSCKFTDFSKIEYVVSTKESTLITLFQKVKSIYQPETKVNKLTDVAPSC